MKKQQKQTETTVSKDNAPLVNEETRKVVKKKRAHTRSFYMAVNPKGGAMPNKKQLPVFWGKSQAKQIASKTPNARVVKVSMSWQ
jgi:hypothetical protein